MTHYAFDEVRSELLAVYTCPVGFRAEVVFGSALLPAEDFLKVSLHLSQVSSVLWQAYERLPQGDVEAMVASYRGDRMLAGYGAVSAAVAGLAAIVERSGVAELAAAVDEQVQADVTAISAALEGMFAGRAVQAAALDRRSVLAAQVIAADRVLRADPLALGLSASGIDAASASVAAVRWLAAAAAVAGRAAGVGSGEVFAVADGIRPTGTGMPALVARRVAAGGTPEDVVVQLLNAGSAEVLELPETGRSRQLLELLLRGIAACCVVYVHHTASVAAAAHGSDRGEQPAAIERFRDAVRAEAVARDSVC